MQIYFKSQPPKMCHEYLGPVAPNGCFDNLDVIVMASIPFGFALRRIKSNQGYPFKI